MVMGWGRGGRGWFGPWPGRGPFSYLPPWQRPGWLFGRGSCWWLFGPWLFGYRFPYYGYPFGWWGYPWTTPYLFPFRPFGWWW